MTIEAARQEIATIGNAMVAAHSSYPLVIEYDNREVIDQASQANPYLQLQVKYLSGQQMDMADHPIVGQFGQILLAAAVKSGAGAKASNDLLDFVIPYLELKKLTLIQTEIFQPAFAGEIASKPGWYFTTGFINFKFFRVSS